MIWLEVCKGGSWHRYGTRPWPSIEIAKAAARTIGLGRWRVRCGR